MPLSQHRGSLSACVSPVSGKALAAGELAGVSRIHRWLASFRSCLCAAGWAWAFTNTAWGAEPEVKKPVENAVEVVAETLSPVREASVRLTETAIQDSDREHWSFRPLARPTPPEVKNRAWPQGEVDRFILARLEAEGLAPQPAADRVTLARRVSFDLTGLPPKPEEVDAFVADSSPQAFEKLVDRLLASPAYGQRAAQHWLDLARFAETDGFEHDLPRPLAWKYRDWVIDALNADLPYDEFVRLQLAGDELRPGDEAASLATGFCLCGPDMPDINSQDERKHTLLNEITSTVGAVFLGLQFGCAQCHDHKYDPVSQADFYRLRAFFENADVLLKPKAGRVLVETSAQTKPSYLMIRGDFRRLGPELAPAFPRIANPWQDTVPAAEKEAKTSGRRLALARWLTRPDHPLVTRVMANRLWQQHFGQALAKSPSDLGIMGDEPSHPELLDWLATELPRRGWSLKAMHKLLVMSATYRQSSRPPVSGPALDDWRRARKADPDNRLLARMNRQRLDGEAIRDAMLASADRISPRIGGQGVMPPLPKELLATLLKGQWQESPDPEDHRRRSIYLFVRRNLRYPLFEVFDRPDTNASCPRRERSTIAPQALVLLNSEFSLSAARDLAGYVLAHAASADRSSADRRAHIELCYRRALGRAPEEEELAVATAFLKDQASHLASEPVAPTPLARSKLARPANLPAGSDPFAAAALVDLCLAVFNLNEFVYVD